MCRKLCSVKIPSSVTSIGCGAFYHCWNLGKIEIALDNASYQDVDGVLFTRDGKVLHTYHGAVRTVPSTGPTRFRMVWLPLEHLPLQNVPLW